MEEFLEKLKPCIEKGELDAGVEEAVRLAEEMGIGAQELLVLSAAKSMNGRYYYVYTLSLAAVRGLGGNEKANAYYNAGLAAQSLGKSKNSEKYYKKAIATDQKHASAYKNYAALLSRQNKKNEAKKYYKKAIELDPQDTLLHVNYAKLLEELGGENEAEEYYKKAIELDPKYASAYLYYGRLLGKLDRKTEAEEYYKKAIEIYPKLTAAYHLYAILLDELDRKTEAEEYYKKAIELNPKFAPTYSDYAIILQKLGEKTEAEKYYKKAIELDPKFAEAHCNYAILLQELGEKTEAEKYYKKAIELDPKFAVAYYNYANLLKELGEKTEAKEYYLNAIKIDYKFAEAHGAYGLLLVELDRKEKAQDEIEKASDLLKESGRITDSYLAWAWLYEQYSEKYFNHKKFPESGEDIYKSGDEYLKASETAEGKLKYSLELRGNEFKAKSFIRKEQQNLKELIENLKNASEFYKKASVCQVDGEQELCGACHGVMDVFSHVLTALDDIIKDGAPSINKNEWHNVLEKSREVYLKIESREKAKKGTDFVDALEQLIKCVDELYEYKVRTSIVQEKRLTDCYNKLIDVSKKVEGGLRNVTDPASDFIKDYAKEMGMPIYEDISIESPPLTFYQKLIKPIPNVIWLIVLGIIASIIAYRISASNLDIKFIEYLKSLIP